LKFEWNASKSASNLAKHGVDFKEASTAFLDPRRILAKDSKHNLRESRYYCIGRTSSGGIAPCASTCAVGKFASLARATGGKESHFMKNAKTKKNVRYTDDAGEIEGELTRIADFLPSPGELADAAPRTKITLAVDTDAVEWFKAEAKRRRGASYQRMMRNLISAYAQAHKKV